MTTTEQERRNGTFITFGVLAYIATLGVAYFCHWSTFAIVFVLVGALIVFHLLWKSQRRRQQQVDESLRRFGSSILQCSPTKAGWIAAGEDWIGVSTTFTGTQRVPLTPEMPFLSGIGVKQYYRRGDVSLPKELCEQFRNKPWLYIPNSIDPFQSILALFRSEAELHAWLALLSDDLRPKFKDAKPIRRSPTQWQMFLRAGGAQFLFAYLLVAIFAVDMIFNQFATANPRPWFPLVFGILNFGSALAMDPFGVNPLMIQRFWLWVGGGDIEADARYLVPIAQNHVVGICDIDNQSQVIVAPISNIQEIKVEPFKPSFFVRDLFHTSRSEPALMKICLTFKNQPDLKLPFLLDALPAQRFVELLKQSSDL